MDNEETHFQIELPTENTESGYFECKPEPCDEVYNDFDASTYEENFIKEEVVKEEMEFEEYNYHYENQLKSEQFNEGYETSYKDYALDDTKTNQMWLPSTGLTSLTEQADLEYLPTSEPSGCPIYEYDFNNTLCEPRTVKSENTLPYDEFMGNAYYHVATEGICTSVNAMTSIPQENFETTMYPQANYSPIIQAKSETTLPYDEFMVNAYQHPATEGFATEGICTSVNAMTSIPPENIDTRVDIQANDSSIIQVPKIRLRNLNSLLQSNAAKNTQNADPNEETGNLNILPKEQFTEDIVDKQQDSTIQQPHYYCVESNKDFASYNSHKVLMRMHTEEQIFECKLCCRKFSVNNDLKKHMLIHIETKPYHCQKCYRFFFTDADYIWHLTYIHDETENVYSCNICEKKYLSQNKLKVHLKYHNRPLKENCPICFKLFTSKVLKNHMLVHTELKNGTQCSICNIEFKDRYNLKAHLVRHGEKKYKCVVCGKQFLTKSECKQHQIVHSEDRRYHCHICYKFFKTMQACKRHIKSHKLHF